MSGTIVVVGGQFGSEAKGHVAAQIVQAGLDRGRSHTLIRVAGPNAGHSAVDRNGKKWALRQIPVAAVIDLAAPLILAAGSEIDLEVLTDEVTALDDAGFHASDRLIVSDEATILTSAHKDAEHGMSGRVGSTAKGIGAARADRLMRNAIIVGQFSSFPFRHGTDDWVRRQYRPNGRRVLIEGTQGFGLGLHAGYYPYCTSSDCRAIDFMAMAGINPGEAPVSVWMVCRTFPIRVAGNSGPLSDEVTWEQLSAETDGYIQPERTTVTQKIRRVGRFDSELVRRAWVANGGGRESADWRVMPVLSFADYLDPTIAGSDQLSQKATAESEFMERSIGAGFRWEAHTTSDRTIIWRTKP